MSELSTYIDMIENVIRNQFEGGLAVFGLRYGIRIEYLRRVKRGVKHARYDLIPVKNYRSLLGNPYFRAICIKKIKIEEPPYPIKTEFPSGVRILPMYSTKYIVDMSYIVGLEGIPDSWTRITNVPGNWFDILKGVVKLDPLK